MNSGEIDSTRHVEFMMEHASTYRVAVDNKDQVVGFIGHVDGDLRLGTRPDRCREGIALFMYSNFLSEYPRVTVRVKRDNQPSLRFFQKVGWKVNQEQWDSGRNPVDLCRDVVDEVSVLLSSS